LFFLFIAFDPTMSVTAFYPATPINQLEPEKEEKITPEIKIMAGQ